MWYSAKLLFESEVMDNVEVSPLCEESIVLIEADNESEATEKAQQIGLKAEHSYANVEGVRVTWHFKRVLELQDLCEESIYSGVEVFSRLFRKQGIRGT